MATIKSIYKGDLRTLNTHLNSGVEIITDAPLDNNGKGQAFSPTDLVACALCDCIFTIAGISAQTSNFNIDGAKAEVTKKMSCDLPRRISEIIIDFDFTMCNLEEKAKRIIKVSAKSCPVSHSIHPDIKQTINYNF